MNRPIVTDAAVIAAATILLTGCSSAVDAAKGTLGISPTPSAATPKAEASKPAKRSNADIAAAVDAAVKEELQVKEYTDACGKVAWACGITEISSGGTLPGLVDVRVQEKLTKDQAERIALYVLNFSVRKVPDVEWVAVKDTSGGTVGQKKRSDSLLS